MRRAAVSQNSAKRRSRDGGKDFWRFAHSLDEMSEADRIELIKTGIAAGVAETAKRVFGLTNQEIGKLLSLSVASYERRRRYEKDLGKTASERLDRIASVAILAEKVLEDRLAASEWLTSNNFMLGGISPLMHCETEIGARQVRRILRAIDWGGVA